MRTKIADISVHLSSGQDGMQVLGKTHNALHTAGLKCPPCRFWKSSSTGLISLAILVEFLLEKTSFFSFFFFRPGVQCLHMWTLLFFAAKICVCCSADNTFQPPVKQYKSKAVICVRTDYVFGFFCFYFILWLECKVNRRQIEHCFLAVMAENIN